MRENLVILGTVEPGHKLNLPIPWNVHEPAENADIGPAGPVERPEGHVHDGHSQTAR